MLEYSLPYLTLKTNHKQTRTLTLLSHNPAFQRLWKRNGLKNIVGKGENAGNKHFLFFPKMFSTRPSTVLRYPDPEDRFFFLSFF